MIFVALGTHHQPFDRLVIAADLLAVQLGERVLLQRGATRLAAPHADVVDTMTPMAFDQALQTARVVVLHAGSSSFLQARALGRRPILVARRPEHGEHVDDHQVRFALSLPPDEAVICEPEALLDAVRTHAETVVVPEDRSRAFCAQFGALVDGLCDRNRHR